MDEPPLLQVGHSTGHLYGILTQSVDQHRALWTDTPQALQQRAQRSQLRHLGDKQRRGILGEKSHVGVKCKSNEEWMMVTRNR